MMTKIPKFASEQEESDFWDTHSATEFWDETTPVDIEFKDVRPRKTLISLRLEEDTIARLKVAAHERGIGYQTLIRMWVLEQLAVAERQAGQVTYRVPSPTVIPPELTSSDPISRTTVVRTIEILNWFFTNRDPVVQVGHQVWLSIASALRDSPPKVGRAGS